MTSRKKSSPNVSVIILQNESFFRAGTPRNVCKTVMTIWISTHKTVLNEKLTRKTLNFVYTINHLNAVVLNNYQKTLLGFLMKKNKTCRTIMIGILANANVWFFWQRKIWSVSQM